MGNTSSVPSSLETQGHPRKPSQKLSKPRTGNPASAGLLPNGFSTSTSRFSSARMSNQALPLSPVVSSYPVVAASAALVPDDNGNTKESIKDKMAAATSTTVQHKESKRRSLFRSLSSQKTTTTQVSGRNPSVGPSPEAPAPPVADKVIRANSMTYESTQAHIAYYAQPPIPVPEKYVFCFLILVWGEQLELTMSPAVLGRPCHHGERLGIMTCPRTKQRDF